MSIPVSKTQQLRLLTVGYTPPGPDGGGDAVDIEAVAIVGWTPGSTMPNGITVAMPIVPVFPMPCGVYLGHLIVEDGGKAYLPDGKVLRGLPAVENWALAKGRALLAQATAAYGLQERPRAAGEVDALPQGRSAVLGSSGAPAGH